MLHKDDREIEVKESSWLSAGYISVAALFGAWLWWQLGAARGIEYFTGYIIEKSLSMDNVFVIAMIFTFFAIPRQYQHRVLFWSILGVIVPSWCSRASRCSGWPITSRTWRTMRC